MLVKPTGYAQWGVDWKKMKAKDIKVGHVYYVDFEPTSNATGLGANKLKIDIKNKLPENLQGKDTYAVYDQVRTLNASRFHELKDLSKSEDTQNSFDVFVDESILREVIKGIIGNLLEGTTAESKREILSSFIQVEIKVK